MIKNITNTLKIIVLAGVLSLGLSVAYAWQGPTLPPPDGNTPTPINVSNVTQTKAGTLKLPGGLGVGSVTSEYYTTLAEGCKAGEVIQYRTIAQSCNGASNSGCTGTSVRTGSHSWGTNSTVETKTYTGYDGRTRTCQTKTCTARQEVKCIVYGNPAASIDGGGNISTQGNVSVQSLSSTGNITTSSGVSAQGAIASNAGADPNVDYGQTWLHKWGLANWTKSIYIEPGSGQNLYLTPSDWVKGGTLYSKFASNIFEGDQFVTGNVTANDFYITKISKWASELGAAAGSAVAGLAKVSHDLSLAGDGTVANPLSVTPQISQVKQVIAKADASGNFVWNNVVNSTLSQASPLGAVDSGWKVVYLQGASPIMGIKMSGSTDEGGLCIANFQGYFSAGLSLAYPITSLGVDGTYTLGSWGGGFGSYPGGEWVFEKTPSGLSANSNLSGQAISNKPLGLSFIPYKVDGSNTLLRYRQIYSNTNGPGGNTCVISVLYGAVVM